MQKKVEEADLKPLSMMIFLFFVQWIFFTRQIPEQMIFNELLVCWWHAIISFFCALFCACANFLFIIRNLPLCIGKHLRFCFICTALTIVTLIKRNLHRQGGHKIYQKIVMYKTWKLQKMAKCLLWLIIDSNIDIKSDINSQNI